MVRFGLALAAAALILDQITKWWILEFVMNPPRIIPMAPFFNLILAWNTGVSFSLFDEGVSPYLFAGLAGIIVVILLVWLRRAENRRLAAGIGLVIGGAVGNVVDRLRFGAVVDFLDFHLAGYHWPAFNIADSAITVGVGLLLADAFFGGDASEDKEKNGR